MTVAPLAGIRVVVTRPEHQAEGLSAAFAEAGAQVEELPLLEVVPPADPAPLDRVAAELAVPPAAAATTGASLRFDWIVFTSANAVDALFAKLQAPLPPGTRCAVVGPATADALRRHGVDPDRVAVRRDAEGLAAELSADLSPGAAVLVPQAADARPELAAGLTAAGAEVTTVVAYDKRLPPDAPDRAREIFGPDPSSPLGWVTFTSPRIVDHFVTLFGSTWESRRPTLRAASIGRVTTRALARQGITPAAEATRPGDSELVAAVVNAITQPAR